MATGTLVIDPGHGGTGSIGGSDGNHAVSPSGVKEKDLTLILANLVKSSRSGRRRSHDYYLHDPEPLM